MTLYGPVRCLVLIGSCRRYQRGGHHCKRSEGRRHHIRHHIAVIILQSPDKAALGTNDTSHSIVNQCIEVLDSGSLEFLLVLMIIQILENLLEVSVIRLGNGILRGEPQIHLLVIGITEAGPCEILDGFVRIVDSLNDPGAVEIMNQSAMFNAGIRLRVDKLCLSGAPDLHLGILIDISVGMTSQHDRSLPGPHVGFDSLYQNRSAENRSVQHGAERCIRTLVKLLQMIFFLSCTIRCNGRTLDSNAVLLCRKSRVLRHLIIGFIAVLQPEIIILGLQLHERKDQVLLDQLPDNSCHFIAIDLYDGSCHLNSRHIPAPLL